MSITIVYHTDWVFLSILLAVFCYNFEVVRVHFRHVHCDRHPGERIPNVNLEEVYKKDSQTSKITRKNSCIANGEALSLSLLNPVQVRLDYRDLVRNSGFDD